MAVLFIEIILRIHEALTVDTANAQIKESDDHSKDTTASR